MIRSILILFLFCSSAFADYTEWYCQATGTNVNAGSTTNAAARFTASNGNWDATTGIFICNGATDLSGLAVGQWVSICVDTTNVTPCIRRITAVVDATDTITVSLTIGCGINPATSATGITLREGGAWRGPKGFANYSDPFPFGTMQNMMTNFPSLLPRVNLKGDADYNITSNLVHSAIGYVRWEGYTQAVGDGGMAHLHGDTNTAVMFYAPFVFSGAGHDFNNLEFSGGGTNANGTIHTNMATFSGSSKRLYRCRFTESWDGGCMLSGASTVGNTFVIECEADRCNINGANGFAGFVVSADAVLIRCWSHDSNIRGSSDSDGYIVSSGNEPVQFINCIASGNTGRGWGITGSSAYLYMYGCASISNSGFGVGFTTLNSSNLQTAELENCLFTGGTWAVVGMSSTNSSAPNLKNCAYWNVGGVNSNVNPSRVLNNIILTANPLLDQGAGDFQLNSTAGAGGALKAMPLIFLQSTQWTKFTTNYVDVGPAQTTNSGAAGGTTTIVIPVGRR